MAGSAVSSLGNIYTPKVSEAQFKSWMASIEERVRTLETQQRLFNASVKGGAITAYNDNLDQIARLGRGGYSTTAGFVTRDVLVVSDSVGSEFHLLVDTLRGWVRPPWPIQFAQETAFETTPAMGTVTAWRANVPMMAQVITMNVYHNTQAGTTGEFWLTINDTYATNHFTSITGGSLDTMQFGWDISSYGLDFGQTITIRLIAAVTAGTGNLYLLAPEFAVFSTIDNVPGATVGGF